MRSSDLKHALILSGPTHEYIDPVRFIGNASSGKMGKAIAEEAAQRGYEVYFISGPVDESNLPIAENIHIHHITCADEMLSMARIFFDRSNVVIFAAAVADYAPAETLEKKIPKSNQELVLRLRPTPDIAQTLCAGKRADQMAIGFALQTGAGEEKARRKLMAKNLDGIVLNTPATLGADNGIFSYLAKDAAEFECWGTLDKTACAQNIFQHIAHRKAHPAG